VEQQEVFARLVKIIREKIAPNREVEISTGATLNELGLDSLDRVELIMTIEEEFRVCISDEDADAILTVGDAVGVIQRALADGRE
jgi:acyl carrier protein